MSVSWGSSPPVQVGSVIKLLTDHGGSGAAMDHIRTNGKAIVTDARHHQLVVDLIDINGDYIARGYYVNDSGRWEMWTGDDENKGLLDDIPNTAEVQAFKDKAYELFTNYAARNGYAAEVMRGLKELGIQKPGTATVTATVTFTVTAQVDEVIPGSTDRTFIRHFDAYNTARKAQTLASHAKSSDVTVAYEVKPYAPVIVPSPTATPAK
jgi:hypothetical protein